MLTESLFNAIVYVINFMLNLLPTMTFPFLEKVTWLTGQVANMIQYANTFLPMTDLMVILGAVILIQNFHIILYFINWIIRRVADIIP